MVFRIERDWKNSKAKKQNGVDAAKSTAIEIVQQLPPDTPLLEIAREIELRAGLAQANIPVWLDTPLVSLHTEGGRVTGVTVARSGQPALIRARGVILTTGGFEHNERMRKEYQREPIGTESTTGSAGTNPATWRLPSIT